MTPTNKKLLRHAANELENLAQDIFETETYRGRWASDSLSRSGKREVERLRRLAKGLRKLEIAA